MKTLITVMALLFAVATTHAQVWESASIRPGDLFKKKKKSASVASDDAIMFCYDCPRDERLKFFCEKMLKQNDTVKISEMIKTGINVNCACSQDVTVLMAAINAADRNIVKYLLDNGATPNTRVKRKVHNMVKGTWSIEYSLYPLEHAAHKNDFDKMDLLIEYGADINKCLDGLKDIAARKSNTQLMVYISQKTGQSGVQANALAMLTEYYFNRDVSKVTVETIRQLLARGADVNAHSPNGKTALINIIEHRALYNKAPLVKELIDHDADLERKENKTLQGAMTYYPKTPLEAAIYMNDLEMVKLLVENGASVKYGGLLDKTKNDKIKEYLILKGAQ